MLLVKGQRGLTAFRNSHRKGGHRDKGGKEGHAPEWVNGGFGGDSSIWPGTADFLGINDQRHRMEAVDTKGLRFWKESNALASTFSLHFSPTPPPGEQKVQNCPVNKTLMCRCGVQCSVAWDIFANYRMVA